MKNLNTLFIIFVLPFLINAVSAQSEWKLEKEKDGIRVYSRTVPNSPFKDFKTIAELADVPYNAVIGQLNDVDSHPEVFNAVEKATLTENTKKQYKILSQLDLPWPMSNRTMWIDNIITHNSEVTDINVAIQCINDKTHEKEGYLHIEKCNGFWQINSLGENKSYIEYQFFLDLGGNAPAKIVNYKSIEENYKTVKAVIERSKMDKYKNYVLE